MGDYGSCSPDSLSTTVHDSISPHLLCARMGSGRSKLRRAMAWAFAKSIGSSGRTGGPAWHGWVTTWHGWAFATTATAHAGWSTTLASPLHAARSLWCLRCWVHLRVMRHSGENGDAVMQCQCSGAVLPATKIHAICTWCFWKSICIAHILSLMLLKLITNILSIWQNNVCSPTTELLPLSMISRSNRGYILRFNKSPTTT